MFQPGSPGQQRMMGPPFQHYPFPQGQPLTPHPYPPGMHPFPYIPSPPFVHGLPGSPEVVEGQAMVAPPPRPPSPMFVSVPPRTQRLLHSEAYLKYIEGLNVETRTVSNFPKMMTATADNTPAPNEARLPSQWLAQGAGYHGSVTNALWALRELMLKDTMTIARTIPFEDL
ncbi:hypothetical protein V1264_021173 [Littorina saxatilis]|uniref:Uncharacterized protein n=1 Tax=Littorina saxatilis TaxID=31220 RepID=A0AAN9BBU6_9CAEN